MPTNILKFFLACCFTVFLCAFIMANVMKLNRADTKVPFVYWLDGLVVETIVKGMIDNGWYWENRFLGAPGSFQMYDYPMADNLHFAVMKLISLAAPDWAVVCNLYYLSTFPLIAFTSLCVFRSFNISYMPAILGSLLFSFLPYHFMRSQAHLFLSGYYLVPPMMMVILWISRGEILAPPQERRENARRGHLILRPLVSISICLLVSSAGVYYAFFACYLMLVAGIACCISRRSIRPLGPAVFLLSILIFGVCANLYPSYAFWRSHGTNPAVGIRAVQESETYALKIAQLFLPISGHRLHCMNNAELKYQQQSSLLNTNDYMGAVGCCGFVLLLGRLPRRRLRPESPLLLDDLLVLTIAAILLASIGSLGSIFSLLVSTSMRCYYRMSVYIAFCSIFAVVVGLDAIARKYIHTWYTRIPGYAVLGGLLALGILDQTGKLCAVDYASTKSEYLRDRAFVRAIEEILPQGALVFQMPYKSFPEAGFEGTHRLFDYELFRGYLHSKTLHWSYGAMRNREEDHWQAAVAQKPLPQLVETLALAGFSGIYIDRIGFADGAAALEAGLSGMLANKPLISENNRLAFFNLTAYCEGLRNRYCPEEWRARQNAALQPLPDRNARIP